jgi:sucrose-6-phosphatase
MHPFLLVTDLDHTLVGDSTALAELNQKLTIHRQTHGTKIVYATGRSLTSYQALTSETPLLEPDILITSVGSEIYRLGTLDSTWAEYLQSGWDREIVWQITQQFPQLVPQNDSEQRPAKVSFLLKPEYADILPQLAQALLAQNIQAKVIYSSEKDVDILPQRADKGQALNYVRELLGFVSSQTIACGDSGNDIALFTVNTRGIIVGNARSELLQWHQNNPNQNRYLAQSHCAAGIHEGLQYFGFLD